MPINKKLINFKTKTQFDAKLKSGDILTNSIVFIEDTGQIWTHGKLYGGSINQTANKLNRTEMVYANLPFSYISDGQTISFTAPSTDGYATVNTSGGILFGSSNTAGYLTIRSGSTDAEFYVRSWYNDAFSTWRKLLHTGNANLNSVDWKAKNLILAGTISGATTISASGELSILKIGRAASFGNTTNVTPGPTADQTSYIQIMAGVGGSTNSSGLVFHNPGISTAVLEYRNTDSNTGYFNFRSDDTNWSVKVNGNNIWHAGNFNPQGALTLYGTTSSGAAAMGLYNPAYNNIILKGNTTNGMSGIFFESCKGSTNINHTTDYGFIQFQPYGPTALSGETNRLVIGVANDPGTDKVVIQVPGPDDFVINYQGAGSSTSTTERSIWHEGNFDPSSKLNVSGGTLTGALHFKNLTWNNIGDDVAIGDCNQSGQLGIKALNNTIPGINFYDNAGTAIGSLTSNAGTLQWAGSTLWNSSNSNSSSIDWNARNLYIGLNGVITSPSHNLYFGGTNNYAHTTYYFRPQWGSAGNTQSNLVLQSANTAGTMTTRIHLSASETESFVSAGKFIKSGVTDSAVLLGAGGHISYSTSGTASTIAARDSAGDLNCRLVRTTYGEQNTIGGGIVFRINSSSDNYLRVCNSQSAIRTWLGVPASSHTHNMNDISDAGNIALDAGTVVRKIFLSRTKNNNGYISRVGLGLTNPVNRFSPALLSVGLNDGGTSFRDFIFDTNGDFKADGVIYSGGTSVSLSNHTHNYAGSSSAGGVATKAYVSEQLEAFTAGNFTGGSHYVKAIRYDGWHTRLYMGYHRDDTRQNTVHVGYADNADTASNVMKSSWADACIKVREHSNFTWLRNSAGGWVFQTGTTGDDWTQSFSIFSGSVASASDNSAWMEIGQRQSNATNGKYRGIRIRKYSGSSCVDGDLQVANVYAYTGAQFSKLNVDSEGKCYVNNTANRRAGMYGVYDSYKTGHIWSMGTAYMIPNDGSNFGNLYGLAYKHTNNTTGGNMASGHQMVWCVNGSPQCAMGDNLWTSGVVIGSRITAGYDSGVANSVNCSDWFRSSGATGWYNATHGGGIRMQNSTWVEVYGGKKFSVNNNENDSIYTTGGITSNTGFWKTNSSTRYLLNGGGGHEDINKIPQLLLGGKIKYNAHNIENACGRLTDLRGIAVSYTSTRLGMGSFKITHNIGHVKYMVTANPFWDTAWQGAHMNCFIRIEEQTSTYVRLRVVNADNGNLVESNVMFGIFGTL